MPERISALSTLGAVASTTDYEVLLLVDGAGRGTEFVATDAARPPRAWNSLPYFPRPSPTRVRETMLRNLRRDPADDLIVHHP